MANYVHMACNNISMLMGTEADLQSMVTTKDHCLVRSASMDVGASSIHHSMGAYKSITHHYIKGKTCRRRLPNIKIQLPCVLPMRLDTYTQHVNV